MEDEEEANEMFDYLPREVVVEILIRLPVKSVVRFRCVCKDWYSLISSNGFITTHTNRALSLSRSDDNNKTRQVLFRYAKSVRISVSRQYEDFSLRSDDGSFGHNNNFIRLNCPLKPDASCSCYFFSNIVGSWNGLFCFAFVIDPSNGYDYTLWNPSIHRALSLPDPNYTFSSYVTLKHFHGFGYDSFSNDIKLVRLTYHGGTKSYIDRVPPLVEIYTLNTGCWRDIATPAPSYIVNTGCLSVFVNGASHWVAHTPPNERTFRNVIIAFDIGDEVFHEIAVPKRFVGKLNFNMNVAVRDGLLCLVPFNEPSCLVPLNERMEEQSFSIWIMKEYGIEESWTKLFEIHISQGLKRVVTFRQNGEVLVTDRYGELLSYEPNTQVVTQLGFHKYSSSGTKIRFVEDWFYLDKYLESLVLLNAKNGVSERLANTSGSRARKNRKKRQVT